MNDALKAKARQSVLGERRELKTLPGFWIRARRFGVTAAERVREAEGLPPSLLRKLARLKGSQEGDLEDDKEMQLRLIEALTDDEFGVLQEKQRSLDPKIVKARLLYGLGQHNLGASGPEAVSDQVSEEFVSELLEYLGTDTIQEMVDAVGEMNPPPFLAGKSDASSSSLSGSSGGQPMRLVGTSQMTPSGETESGPGTPSDPKS
ncbi:MAG: hypothetical protein IT186_14040 [Acidobacteria bacterium]|nr:hypothetical protein [Acidobacteriota bacterium]